MLRFQVTVHARPAEAVAGPEIELSAARYRTLNIPRASLATPLAVSFEQAQEALGRIDRLFFEPDGSFVWTSSQADQPWQLDGNVFDRSGRVQFVDLKGTCPTDDLDKLLAAFGWPGVPVIFQLTREAVFLDESEFRRFAARAS